MYLSTCAAFVNLIHRTNTLLHIAVQKKKIATVNYLIRHEYQLLHMSNKKGNLPLHEACSVGDEKTAILLLRTLDTDMLHSTNNDGQTPLDVLHTCDHPRFVCMWTIYSF